MVWIDKYSIILLSRCSLQWQGNQIAKAFTRQKILVRKYAIETFYIVERINAVGTGQKM